MVHVGKMLAVAMAAALAAGCTATIDQSSFFPSESLRAPEARLAVPAGYAATSRMIDLTGLGVVHAVWLDSPQSDTTIIYSAGNGGFVDSETTSKAAANLARITGADIILYDYPGRGGTTLPATIEAAIAVGPRLVDQFRAMGWLGKGPAYAYGFSFGGSMAAAMARGAGFAGLIIEGSAADYARIGRDFVPGIAKPFVRLKVSEDLKAFDYFGYALAAKAPILLLSGNDDTVVRQKNVRSFGEELAARGATVTFRATPGGHGAALDSAEGEAALRTFVAAR